ncbi:uncharacterized protein LOC136025552 [Artemia franciscana]|uniref:uncharacterized protein LOC136025552 n=1 Tax=Artemia franciscana TaxID=6661 RepID=UPI0032DB6433
MNFKFIFRRSILWNLIVLILLSRQGVAGDCTREERQVCSEKGKICQTAYGRNGILKYECVCQFPLIEKVETCKYEPAAVHYGVKVKLSSRNEDLGSKIKNHIFLARLQDTGRRIFPGATVALNNVDRRLKKANSVKEVPSFWFKNGRWDYYAKYRISAKQLSKNYVREAFQNSFKNGVSSEYFDPDDSSLVSEVIQIDAKPCSLCSHTQRCNPSSKTLCSCQTTAENCADFPDLKSEIRNIDDFGEDHFEDSLRAFRNEEKNSRDMVEVFSPCTFYQKNTCDLSNATCVPALNSMNYTCECQYPYIDNNGICQRIDELKERIYEITLPLRGDSPWSLEMLNPNSLRYQRMKRSAKNLF